MVVYISRIFSVLAVYVYSLQENSRQFTESRVAKHGENAFYEFAVAQENEYLHIMRRSLELSGVGTLK
eukprot:scaffold6792_cov37-Cyclotella_meneghiniana.AAC.4